MAAVSTTADTRSDAANSYAYTRAYDPGAYSPANTSANTDFGPQTDAARNWSSPQETGTDASTNVAGTVVEACNNARRGASSETPGSAKGRTTFGSSFPRRPFR